MAPRSKHNGLIPAVAYYRMSSDKQEASIPEQREAVEAYAKAHDYRIVREYLDEGISGDKTSKRVDFQRLHHDACNGRDFDVILCWNQDRFGRFDSVEAGYWIHPLRQAGVRLATVSDGLVDWNSFAGRVVNMLQTEGKHQFLRTLSADVVRGQAAAASEGKWIGIPPRGFKIGTDGKLALGHQDDIDVLTWLFDSIRQGQTPNGLTRLANQGKLCGRTWSASSLRKTLRNVAYVGDYYREGGKGKYTKTKPIFIKNNHPPIISRRIFNAVQKRLDQRSTSTPKPNGGGYVLSGGLLKCGQCDAPMYGRGLAGTKFYMCSGHTHKGMCNGPNRVTQDQILAEVIAAIERQYTNPKVIQRLREELRKQVPDTSSKVTMGRMKNRLAAIDQSIDKAERNMLACSPDMVARFEKRIRQLEAERTELTAELKTARLPRNQQFRSVDEKIDQAIKLYSSLRETLERADMQLLRSFIKEAIDHVVVDVKTTHNVRGRQHGYQLLGGAIHMRSTNLCTKSTPPPL